MRDSMTDWDRSSLSTNSDIPSSSSSSSSSSSGRILLRLASAVHAASVFSQVLLCENLSPSHSTVPDRVASSSKAETSTMETAQENTKEALRSASTFSDALDTGSSVAVEARGDTDPMCSRSFSEFEENVKRRGKRRYRNVSKPPVLPNVERDRSDSPSSRLSSSISSNRYPDQISEHLLRLSSLISQIDSHELGLNCTSYLQLKFNSLRYQSLVERDRLSVGLFFVPAGHEIPLHDHPNMFVLSLLVCGELEAKSYEWIHRQDDEGIAISVVDQVYQAPCLLPIVTPVSNNLHYFVAKSNVAFLDFTMPPYNDDAGRPCTYYEITSTHKAYDVDDIVTSLASSRLFRRSSIRVSSLERSRSFSSSEDFSSQKSDTSFSSLQAENHSLSDIDPCAPKEDMSSDCVPSSSCDEWMQSPSRFDCTNVKSTLCTRFPLESLPQQQYVCVVLCPLSSV